MQKIKIPRISDYFSILKINHRISGLSNVRSKYYAILIVKFILEIWSFINIYLLGLAFDKLIRLNETKDINGFYWLLGIYMGGGIIASLVKIYVGYLEALMYDQTDSLLQKLSLTRIIAYPLSWHSKQSAGNKYKLIGEGANAASNLMGESIEIIIICFTIIISLSYLIWLNIWFMVLVFFFGSDYSNH